MGTETRRIDTMISNMYEYNNEGRFKNFIYFKRLKSGLEALSLPKYTYITMRQTEGRVIQFDSSRFLYILSEMYIKSDTFSFHDFLSECFCHKNPKFLCSKLHCCRAYEVEYGTFNNQYLTETSHVICVSSDKETLKALRVAISSIYFGKYKAEHKEPYRIC